MAKSEEAGLENENPSIHHTQTAHDVQLGTTEKYGTNRNLIEEGLFDERYAQTQRGLNNRQVQMM